MRRCQSVVHYGTREGGGAHSKRVSGTAFVRRWCDVTKIRDYFHHSPIYHVYKNIYECFTFYAGRFKFDSPLHGVKIQNTHSNRARSMSFYLDTFVQRDLPTEPIAIGSTCENGDGVSE